MIVRALERRAETFNPVHPRDPGVLAFVGPRETAASIQVTDSVALTYSAIFACVKVLGETLGSVPLGLFERRERGRRRATEQTLYRKLHTQPNPEMTSPEFRETLQGHIGLRGNGIAEVVRTPGGDVDALWPIPPGRQRRPIRRNGTLWYPVDLPGGGMTALRHDQVLHVRGIGSTGLWGYSPVDQARESIGLAIAAREYGARFYANDGTPPFAIKLEKSLGKSAEEAKAAANRYRATWDEAHQPLTNKHRFAFLEEGASIEKIGVDPENAQAIETQKFSIRDVARWYRIPPHLIGDFEEGAATRANLETQTVEFIRYTMLPWFVKWEAAIARDLIGEADAETLYAEFVLEGFLRGDSAARAQFYKEMWQTGSINSDEIRERENMDPIEDGSGSTYYVPLNFVPADQSRQVLLPARSEARFLDQRAAQQAGEGRRRLALAFAPMFEQAATRVVNAEIREVRKEAQAQLGSRDILTFADWLVRFYQDHEGFAADQLRPAYEAYVVAIAKEAAEVAGAEMPDSAWISDLAAGMAAVFAVSHASASAQQLKAVLDDNRTDPLPAIEQRLDEWRETRPAKIAKRRTVEGAGAVSKRLFARSGITRLRWVAFGESCPFCTQLNGRVVGIEDHFAAKDQLFEADGAAPLRLRTNISYPPIHGGCDCQIVPG